MERWVEPLRRDPATDWRVRSLRNRYKEFCRMTCSLQTPCCDDDTYTHLPDEHLRYQQFERSLALLPSRVLELRKLVARYCAHRLEPHQVIAFSRANFGDRDTRELVERTLRHIVDDERRARLMLAYLYQFPKISTRCHGALMYFNCKRRGHHGKCDDFHQPVDESKCLLRCRSCHILLMKVEGCDHVVCVCGFRLNWSSEIARRDAAEAPPQPHSPARAAVRRRR